MNRQNNHPAEYPRTVAEAADWLETVLPDVELERIAAMDEDHLIGLHFELGAYIRDRLGLWVGNDALKADAGVRHAVDVSMAIIKALWQRHHNPVPFGIPA